MFYLEHRQVSGWMVETGFHTESTSTTQVKLLLRDFCINKTIGALAFKRCLSILQWCWMSERMMSEQNIKIKQQWETLSHWGCFLTQAGSLVREGTIPTQTRDKQGHPAKLTLNILISTLEKHCKFISRMNRREKQEYKILVYMGSPELSMYFWAFKISKCLFQFILGFKPQ